MGCAQAVRELTDGSALIVRGALQAGCTFFAGYPTSAASGILDGMLRELPPRGAVAIQAEDEIASIGMCIGAVLAGARALTATSGPGMSLYSENLGLAVTGEVPLVVVDVQRLRPATEGATTVGQGDVQFSRWGTSGGFPLIVLSPSTLAECYSLTQRAFALSERFRCPVVLLTDEEFATTLNTVEVEQLVVVPVPPRCEGAASQPVDPCRHDPADGLPPLVPLGDGELVRFTGPSPDRRRPHSEAPATVGALHRRLTAKIESHRAEIEAVAYDEQVAARTLLVGYGVTASAVREAARRAREHGRRVSTLTIHSLWPVPETALARALARHEHVVVAELNLGDYRREIERVAGGRAAVVGTNRVDGQLITPEQLLGEIL